MAIKKYLIKMDHQQAVWKIVNDTDTAANMTIALLTDMLKANETVDSPSVSIRAMEWSTKDSVGEVKITRNAVLTQRVFATGFFENAYGADKEQEAFDIVVNMTGGTVVLHLLKSNGYKANFQPEQHGGE